MRRTRASHIVFRTVSRCLFLSPFGFKVGVQPRRFWEANGRNLKLGSAACVAGRLPRPAGPNLRALGAATLVQLGRPEP